MVQRDSEFWIKARLARAKLATQYLDYPDVSLIDIGYPPGQGQDSGQIVLRIHVRESWLEAKQEDRFSFPEQEDGISVIVVPGDYYLSRD